MVVIERTLYIDQTAPKGAFTFTSLTGNELAGFTNNENIKLFLSDIADNSGLFNSGVSGIYLWNTDQRPNDFHVLELFQQLEEINLEAEILSALAAGKPGERKGLYLDLPTISEDSFNINL